MGKKSILIVFFYIVSLLIISYLSFLYLTPKTLIFFPEKRLYGLLPEWISRLGAFDGVHYALIGWRGYQNLEYSFLPVYPVLIWILNHSFGISATPGSLIISLISFFGSILVMLKLIVHEKLKISKQIFLLIFITFPTSYYFLAGYNDSIYLLLSVLIIYTLSQKRFLLSGLLVSLACMTRFNGLALLLYYIFELIISHNKWRLYKKYIVPLFVTLICTILFWFAFLYFGYLNHEGWNAPFATMQLWGRGTSTMPWIVVYRYLRIFLTVSPFTFVYFVAILETLSVIFYVFLTVWWWRKNKGYSLLIFASIIIPWISGTWQGMPRYGLHLYPMFVFLAYTLSKKSHISKIFYFLVAGIFQALLLLLFLNGYFLA